MPGIGYMIGPGATLLIGCCQSVLGSGRSIVGSTVLTRTASASTGASAMSSVGVRLWAAHGSGEKATAAATMMRFMVDIITRSAGLSQWHSVGQLGAVMAWKAKEMSRCKTECPSKDICYRHVNFDTVRNEREMRSQVISFRVTKEYGCNYMIISNSVYDA